MILPALTALIAVVNEAHVWGIASPLLIGGLLIGIILLLLFVFVERRAATPLVELSLFRNGAFAAGNAAGLISYAMLFGLFFLMPFIFIRAYGDSALMAGLRLSVVPVVLGLTSPFSGALSDRLGARRLAVSGMIVCAGALMLLMFAADGIAVRLPLVMLALALVGLGQGLFTSPNNNSIMASAPARLTGEAGGLMNVMRSCGMSIGIAAAAALLSWRLSTLTGDVVNTIGLPPDALFAASRDVTLMLVGFAAMAAVLSLIGSRGRVVPAPRLAAP